MASDTAQRQPRDWIQALIGSTDRALLCTAPDGTERAFTAVPLAGGGRVYVEAPMPPAHPEGTTVTETAVRNAVERCHPDVSLVDEAEVWDRAE